MTSGARQSPPVAPMSKRHSADSARLHSEGIDTGFLSSLGRVFLRQIYKAVPACPVSFGYVWEEAGRVIGFIAFAESTGRFYKQALVRRFVPMLWALKWHVLRPAKVKRMWQTLRYPAEVGTDLPAAELLSIAVDESGRGRGVGKALVAAGIEEFRRRGIERFKVAVGAGNETANAFYQRCGFEQALQREHHGLPMNVYVFDTTRS